MSRPGAGAWDPRSGAWMGRFALAGLLALLAVSRGEADDRDGTGREPYAVRFSHNAHLARGVLPCQPCHDAGDSDAKGPAESPVPGPVPAPMSNLGAAPARELISDAADKGQCAGCHDGAQAFSVTGPHCRRCHVQGTGVPDARARRGPAFSHRDHQARGVNVNRACRTCHALDARGTPLPPAPDHMPCAEAACHRDQFSARAPKICGACHLGTEPWARLHFDRPPQGETEFGARFSHRLHQAVPAADTARPAADAGPSPGPSSSSSSLSASSGATAAACTACHGARAQRMGLPAGHAACTGPACHAAAPAGAPAVEATRAAMPLDACERCHASGLLAARVAARLQQPWSVRARFRHEPHGVDPTRGAALSCTACHADVLRSETLADIPGPPKAVCAPCHDGRVSFKLTGHGCARCHGHGLTP